MRACLLGLSLMLSAGGAAATPEWCAEKPVKFAGITWESAQFFTEVARIILEKGYGCRTEVVKAAALGSEAALIANELQVLMEDWGSEVLIQARNKGQIDLIGNLLVGGTVEGWFVPEYVIHGDAARGIKPLAPDLKSVADLVRYKDVFKDDGNPGKAHFLNCPTVWNCRRDNSQKLKAYKLDGIYTDVIPPDGAAMDAVINAAYERGDPLLFYYWAPTAMLGKFRLVQLQEPPFNAPCWNLIHKTTSIKYVCGSSTPPKTLTIGVSMLFQKSAPELIEFFKKYALPVDVVNHAVAGMSGRKRDAAVMAREFMRGQKLLWTQWVPPEVVKKIEKEL